MLHPLIHSILPCYWQYITRLQDNPSISLQSKLGHISQCDSPPLPLRKLVFISWHNSRKDTTTQRRKKIHILQNTVLTNLYVTEVIFLMLPPWEESTKSKGCLSGGKQGLQCHELSVRSLFFCLVRKIIDPLCMSGKLLCIWISDKTVMQVL